MGPWTTCNHIQSKYFKCSGKIIICFQVERYILANLLTYCSPLSIFMHTSKWVQFFCIRITTAMHVSFACSTNCDWICKRHGTVFMHKNWLAHFTSKLYNFELLAIFHDNTCIMQLKFDIKKSLNSIITNKQN